MPNLLTVERPIWIDFSDQLRSFGKDTVGYDIAAQHADRFAGRQRAITTLDQPRSELLTPNNRNRYEKFNQWGKNHEITITTIRDILLLPTTVFDEFGEAGRVKHDLDGYTESLLEPPQWQVLVDVFGVTMLRNIPVEMEDTVINGVNEVVESLITLSTSPKSKQRYPIVMIYKYGLCDGIRLSDSEVGKKAETNREQAIRLIKESIRGLIENERGRELWRILLELETRGVVDLNDALRRPVEKGSIKR